MPRTAKVRLLGELAVGAVNGTVETNPVPHDLAGTGKSFQGGSAILAMVAQGPGNGERLIKEHTLCKLDTLMI